MHTCVTLQTIPTGATSASVTAIVALPTAKYDICSANRQQDPLQASVTLTICIAVQKCRTTTFYSSLAGRVAIHIGIIAMLTSAPLR